jgi:RNA polymerase sigma-70 factor (ECF subfamily)
MRPRWGKVPGPGSRAARPGERNPPDVDEPRHDTPAPAEADPDDGRAVELVLEGRREEFAFLVGRYHRRLFRYVVGNLHEPGEADDIVQKSFVTAYQSLASYNPQMPFFDWLRGIARNHCRNAWRNYQRRARLTGRLIETKRAEWEAARLGRRDAADDGRLAALEACLASFGETEADLIRKRFFDRLPLRTLAAQLGRSPDAVRLMLYRLRTRLAACIRLRLGSAGGGAK